MPNVLSPVASTVLEQAPHDHASGTMFGERYDDTAWLAVWRTAEVTNLPHAHPDPVWRAAQWATVSRPTSREIQTLGT